jgi:hypothetical protein
MFKKILTTTMIMANLCSFAQLKTPKASPLSTLTQNVGVSEIKISYSRPSVNQRDIFGDVVPYNQLWRTGANSCSTVEINTDFTIFNTKIPSGKYSILSRPSNNQWIVYFYKDTDFSGVPKDFDESKVAGEFKVPVTKISQKQETFLISIENITSKSFNLNLSWENQLISLPIQLPTHEIVMENIKKTMQSSNVTANEYYAAADYYFENNIDLNQALVWVKKSTELHGKNFFWILRKQAQIEEKLGKKKDAVKTATIGLEEAKNSNNEQYTKYFEDIIKNNK